MERTKSLSTSFYKAYKIITQGVVILVSKYYITGPQRLAFFGSIKITTRLKDDDKISNDYFLVGNIASVLMVIAYYLPSQHFT